MEGIPKKKAHVAILCLILISVFATESFCQNQAVVNNKNDIQETFQLLKEGDEKIQLLKEYKNVILVLGTSGGGKSTFVQWIAGDNSQLISKEIAEGEFIIEDGSNRIGNSTTKSMTTFPELVVERKTNSAYYDCPGFSDTRSVSVDIATTYFIKKVTDHADSVKMVFIVSYHAVRHGVDRHKFMTLLTHATEFIEDIDKYKNSIAMVVTKVDNKFKKIKGRQVLVSSEMTIKGIVEFLNTVRKDLIRGVSDSSISVDKKTFNEKAVKFIDALLLSNGEKYLKIAIFRRPDEEGLINEIPLLQEGKSQTEWVIYKNLKFTSTENNDFGYTISPDSKNTIYILVQKINTEVYSALGYISNKILAFFIDTVMNIKNKLNEFAKDTKTLNSDFESAKKLMGAIKKGSNDIGRLISDVKNVFPSKLPSLIEKITKTYGIKECEEHLLHISSNARYYDFLHVLSDRELEKKAWEPVLYPVSDYLANAKIEISTYVETLIKEANANIFSFFKKIMELTHDYNLNLVSKLRATLQNLTADVMYKDTDIKANYSKLIKRHSLLLNLLQQTKNSTGVQLAKKFEKLAPDWEFSGGEKYLETLMDNSKYLEVLETLGAQQHVNYPYEVVVNHVYVYLTQAISEVQKDIQDSASRLREYIKLNAEKVAHTIEEHYEKHIEASDIQKLPSELRNTHTRMLTIVNKIKNLNSAEELSETVEKLNEIDGVHNFSAKIKNAGKNLSFLKDIYSLDLDIWSVSWVSPFDKTAKFLDDSVVWYNYLGELYSMLSEYNVQSDTKKFDVADVGKWGKGGGSKGIYISKQNFGGFLKMTGKNIEHSLKPTENSLYELNILLELTLKRELRTTCMPGELVLLGEYIKFSDLVDGKRWKNICSGHTQTVTIVALNTVFIDKDLIAVGDKLRAIIIAPKWKIIGSRVINLNGVDAENHNPGKALNGRLRADDGLPGLPGGAAGSLHGIGIEFFNSESLKITADGGNGGRGQGGGDGLDGNDGRTPPTSDDDYYCDECYCKRSYLLSDDKITKTMNGFYYDAHDNDDALDTAVRIIGGIGTFGINNLVTENAFVPKITVYGEKGGDGGRPGNGGVGGKGGNPGYVSIISLGSVGLMSISMDNGKVGESGVGGLGGKGGRHGENVLLSCTRPFWSTVWEVKGVEAIPGNGGESFTNGIDGANISSRKNPEEIKFKIDIKSIVGLYKSAFSEGLYDTHKIFRRNLLSQFLEQLKRNNY